jgi:hypothetical protein
MARTRMLKPEFFRSRSLARVSRDARLTFQGLWMEADAKGRGLAHLVILKGCIWPLDDDITPQTINDHLQELSVEHIQLYEVGEDTFYAVKNWDKHQSAAYRTGESKHPEPPKRAKSVQPAQPVVQPARPVVHKGIEEKKLEGKTIAAVAARNNPLWDALTVHFGEPATATEKSNRGRHCKELTEAQATPADIHARVQEHKRRRLSWTLTANALIKHWTDLEPKAPKDNRIWDHDTQSYLAPGAMR